jgi:hypothetical protein
MWISFDTMKVAANDRLHLILSPERRIYEGLAFLVENDILAFGSDVVICERVAGPLGLQQEINGRPYPGCMYSVDFA